MTLSQELLRPGERVMVRRPVFMGRDPYTARVIEFSGQHVRVRPIKKRTRKALGSSLWVRAELVSKITDRFQP